MSRTSIFIAAAAAALLAPMMAEAQTQGPGALALSTSVANVPLITRPAVAVTRPGHTARPVRPHPRIRQARIQAARLKAARIQAARIKAARIKASRIKAARIKAARIKAARIRASRG